MQWQEAKSGSACNAVMTQTAAMFKVAITASMTSEADLSSCALLFCCIAFLQYSKRSCQVMRCRWVVSECLLLAQLSQLWKTMSSSMWIFRSKNMLLTSWKSFRRRTRQQQQASISYGLNVAHTFVPSTQSVCILLVNSCGLNSSPLE